MLDFSAYMFMVGVRRYFWMLWSVILKVNV